MLALLLQASTTPCPASPTATLMLADALARAAGSSPSLAAAAERVRQAEFALRGARAVASPEINLGRGFGQNAAGNDEDIILTETLELGGKAGARRGQAAAELTAARAAAAQVRSALTFQVKNAYYTALEAEAVATLDRELVEIADRFEKAALAQLAAGEVPRAQLLRSEIELATARQALLTAENDQFARRAALNTLLGAAPGGPLLLVEPAPLSPLAVSAEALQRLSEQRPDLRAAAATLAARRAAARLAAAGGRPDLVLQAVHARLDQYPGNTLRLGFVWPLFDMGRQRAARGAAAAAEREQAANVEALRRQVRLEVETALHGLEQARRVVESVNSSILGQSRLLREMAETGYREGENSYLELLDAQRVYRTASTDALRAMTAYRVAEAALEQAVGVPLPAGAAPGGGEPILPPPERGTAPGRASGGAAKGPR